MSGLNLEQTGRNVEESLRKINFDPAALLRRAQTPPAAAPSINSEPPGTAPPPVSQVPGATPPAPAPGNTEIPNSPVREIRSGESVQYAVRIPEGVENLASFVEESIRRHLNLDGVHPPVSRANPAEAPGQPSYDDAALLAELAAWFKWKGGGGGTEPTIPVAWRDTIQRVWHAADVGSLTFESTQGVLSIRGLTPEQATYVYAGGAPGFPEEPGSVLALPPLGETEGAGVDWSFLFTDPEISGANPGLGNLPALIPPIGGSPMTMVAPAAGTAAASAGSALWAFVKRVGIPAAIGYLTSQLVEQGLDENTARQQAEMAVSAARPKGRRRRRRMLTCSDREDILFLKSTLGSGELGKAAISALLAGCRR